MSYYAKHLRTILRYIETLDGLEDPREKDIGAYATRVPLVDVDDPDRSLGYLSNPDGIGWEWTPPEADE